jgi:hypothetical protein
MGYFPAGYRPYSDLAHAVRSADLGRALVGGAETVVERAFAWGWVTHILADSWVHPIIACATGELLHGSPAHFVDGDTDCVAHVRVEAGLDAVYADRHPELRALPLAPVFNAFTVGYVTRAFEATYGPVVDESVLLHSHVSTARHAPRALQIASLVARTLPVGGQSAPVPLVAGDGDGALRSRLGSRNQALAFLFPAPPPLWLINATDDVVGAFVELFLEEYDDGLASLENYNLDNGRPEAETLRHGARVRSLAFLARHAGQAGVRAS